MGWVEEHWQQLSDAGPGAWLAMAAWAGCAVGLVALIYLGRLLRENRRLTLEKTRPHVTVFMESHAADWHIIELVARNFGQTPAYDIRFSFDRPLTVARYETAVDGYADVVTLQLPEELPVLAPGQEWRTVWDSAIDRAELGDSIESRFTGAVSYADRPHGSARWRPWRRGSGRFQNRVTLDWHELPPVQRIELLTTHDLATREKQKLELLRSLLSYFHYASKETRPDVFRREVDRVNRAAREAQDRLHARALPEQPTNVTVRLAQGGDAAPAADPVAKAIGKHRS